MIFFLFKHLCFCVAGKFKPVIKKAMVELEGKFFSPQNFISTLLLCLTHRF